MNDNDIIKIFYKNDKLITVKVSGQWLNKHPELTDYLNNRFSDSESYLESIYRIKNNIEIRPTCQYCNKPLKFKLNFKKYCSASCSNKSETTKKKYKQTCLEKYGVDNYAKTQECTEKIKNVFIKKYSTHYMNTDEFKNKSKHTCIIKYGGEPNKCAAVRNKIKQTCLERYGVDNYSKTKEFKINFTLKADEMVAKKQQTCLERYGFNDYSKTKEFQEKQYQTKRKNNSFHTSKPENKLYEILCDKFGTDNIIRQYKSNLYPFVCDFYIKNLDLYIEYNGNWTHGKHPFNENDPDDLNKVKFWKDKSIELNIKGKQKRYYNAAIYVWTNLDVRKRNIAKQNNLNFVEIWNLNEINTKINNILNNDKE